MLIKIPEGHAGLHARCRCSADHEQHDCFYLGSPALRGYCGPCFEAQVIDPLRNELQALQSAFAREMTRVQGWRIRNERSYEVWARLESGSADRRSGELGGYPHRPRSRDEDIA